MRVFFKLPSIPVAALKVLAATLMLTGLLTAQSGRQIPKPAAATPLPTPTTDRIPEPKPRPKPSFVLKVVADLPMSVYEVFPKPENMQFWAIERLRTSSLLDVRDAGKANRRDAIRLAKSETEDYVVWLQLQDDPFNRGGNMAASGAVTLSYEIFLPTTGKTKEMGRVTLNQDSATGKPPSGVIMAQSCHKGVYGNDFILLQASVEAAERMMSALNIPLPPDCRPAPPFGR